LIKKIFVKNLKKIYHKIRANYFLFLIFSYTRINDVFGYLWILIKFSKHNPPQKKRDIKKILFCMNKYYDKNQKEVSTDYINLFETFENENYKLSLFFWDDLENNFFFKRIIFIKEVISIKPDYLILSTYSPSIKRNPNHPSVFLIQFINKILNIKIVIYWGDTCYKEFVKNQVKPIIKSTNLHIIPDNPLKKIDINLIAQEDRSKILYTFSPFKINKNFYPNLEKNINVCFLGQIDSYRNYRKEYIDYLLSNKVEGYFSTKNRNQQLTHNDYRVILGKSKMSINFSFSVDFDQVKSRVFEVMLSQSMLLESTNDQTSVFYEEGVDYISFKTKEDLYDKINYFLKHEDQRKKIADNGYKKTIEIYNNKVFWNNIIKNIN